MRNHQEIWDAFHTSHGMAAVAGPGPWNEEKYLAAGRTFADCMSPLVGGFTGKRVLDYGCGDGRIAAALAAEAGLLVCADASPVILAACQQRIPRARTVRAERPVDVPGGPFDLIYSIGVLYHMPDVEAMACLVEFAELVAPGGYVCIDHCNIFHPLLRPPLLGAIRARSWEARPPWVPMDGASLVHVAVTFGALTLREHVNPDGSNPLLVFQRPVR
jgi:2-polyprenyl-3-methyl-5-hydroxy-6-metoxy-1,4-benzoquinol methylase